MPSIAEEIRALHRLAPIGDHIEDSLRDATRHALNTEGSFSRAKLAGGLAKELGLSKEYAENLGGSIELFHLASLLLDDLPCMDNADTRRTKSCTHLLYGDNATILSALGLINQAYFHLWKLFATKEQSIQQEAARITQECLGFQGILDGQSKDINYYFSHNNQEHVAEIAEKKTGSLFRLCLLLPAVLTEASRYEKLQLSNLARDWGLAYQIADDLKDIYYSDTISGKSSHKDAELGRPNMALAIGEVATANLLDNLINRTQSNIEALKRSRNGIYATLDEFQNEMVEKVTPLLKAFAAA